MISKILEIAKAELDTAEVAGNEDNPKILEYLKCVIPKGDLHDEIAWCSAFACWVVEKAGFISTMSAAARSWLSWGSEVTHPYPGCIVVLKRGSGWQGHVGFFISMEGDFITVLGGNQKNRVCYQRFPKADVLGYRETGLVIQQDQNQGTLA